MNKEFVSSSNGSENLLNAKCCAPSNAVGKATSTLNGPADFARNQESGCGDGVQPLYVNAPPKPRRTAECWENYCDNRNNSAQSDKNHEYVISKGRHFSCSYAKTSSGAEARYTSEGYRTTPPSTPSFQRQQQKPSPLPLHNDAVSFRSSKAPRCAVSDYEELYTSATGGQQMAEIAGIRFVASSPSRRNKSVSSRNPELGNRPHSVDFLQSPSKCIRSFENVDDLNLSRRKAVEGDDSVAPLHAPLSRPKSSTDVVTDNFHWSEEQYAESMRKSAQYLIPITNQPHLIRNIVANTKFPSSRKANLRDACPVITSTDQSISNEEYVDNRSKVHSHNDFMRSKSARVTREKLFDKSIGYPESKRSDRAHTQPKESTNNKPSQHFQQVRFVFCVSGVNRAPPLEILRRFSIKIHIQMLKTFTDRGLENQPELWNQNLNE